VTQSWNTRLLGYANEEGVVLTDAQCPIAHVMQTRKPLIANIQMLHEDGHWVDIESQTVPLIDNQGVFHGVAEIVRDRSRTTRKAQEYHDLRLAASRDALTGVANRGELETKLTALLNESVRTSFQDPLSVIFLDVDHFKMINDRHGHSTGDKVLIELTKSVQQETYCGEILGRYGGEEFVLLCSSTTLEQAVSRANRIRVALNRLKLKELKGGMVAASFGVTEAVAGDSVESVLRRADKALYTAKKTGRNRTCSLTMAEMSEAAAAKPAGPKARQFVFQGNFAACIASDMVVYKLGGFVNDEGARLLEVTRDRALLRLGYRGILPFWGGSDSSQPVDLEVLFGEEVAPRESQGSMIRSCMVHVTARVRPVGWVKSQEAFEARAMRVLKKLCSYFASELQVS